MSIVERIRKGDCDEVDLLDYITDNDVEVAIAAAQSKLATEPILDIAARDKDKRVRFAALCNPNIGKETVQYLTNDPDNEIAEKALAIMEGR